MSNTTKKDITMRQGYAPQEFFVVLDSDGAPFDLITNDISAEIKVRRGYKPDAEVLAVFSNDNGKLKYTQAYNGRIDFAFDGTEFIDEDIKGYENSYNYDMHFYSPGTTKYYEIFEGFWIVKSAS